MFLYIPPVFVLLQLTHSHKAMPQLCIQILYLFQMFLTCIIKILTV